MSTPVIIVHGGAWTIPDDIVEGSRAGTKAAARAGYAVLSSGGTAIDAIQAAIRVLEDDPCFDAGTGSVLTAKGDVEMDAVIMDGRTLKSGAVACVHNIKNPIELARKVMEKTDHCLLVGPGADLFAEEVGIKRVPTESLVSAEAVRELEFYHANYDCTVHDLFRQRGSSHDTVGAVALDVNGNVAYGTSTGGISCKKPGRVGDSPIIGAGGYADNDVGGISCTGHGESISKVVLAHQVITAMKTGTDAQEAADKALANMASRVDGYGGVIVLGREGDVALSFTTERMSWAWAKEGTIHSGVNPGEDFREPVDVTNGDVANGDVQNGGASNCDV
ncbi:isoaspartyl peptidase/L-asparaginase-like [Mya arenaria]|uniref:isoaspartyl peptidase/L-asparaginase-like n=1 Tax=Mya arenaria TaxID=6604 RepID=UPI0022E39FBE|nr:isoaspartyl peptidase/L-asparaginase-like [Mya arenaria]XP_052767392.1 isoaspartyl peptidase/L-asparaginase-like [Mya arenaria]XP_052767393.1 isoaspartyl peptidase/L-asparaginase-like [Mya arenaria]